MAETEVTRRRYDYRDAGSRPAAVSRGLTSFILSTFMFTATYFLLVKLWGGSLQAMPQFPMYQKGNGTGIRNQEGNSTGIRNSWPTLHFGSLAPDPVWQFRPEAMARVRNSTGKLHPSVYLVKSSKRLPKLAQYETVKCTGEGETRETETHCRTDHSSTIGHYNTCAVVGNSGVLLGSHCGNEIDSKDYVIRMGIPVVRGYENDVGRRTSMTILNLGTPQRIRKSASLCLCL
ncbi:uncharacterized protein LOC144918865 [Branchiostoma floridae x Branchiostoma belcheri]